VGTSANFEGPPNWSPVKSAVTRMTGSGHVTRHKAGSMVRSFVGKMRESGRSGFGGQGGHGRGGGGGGGRGRGGGGGGGGGVRGAARAFGHFVTEVAAMGLAEALRNLGLGSLEGKTPEEIAMALLDALCGPGSTIDSVDLRNALSALVTNLLGDAANFAGAEQALAAAAGSLEQLVQDLFGNYIYERFQTTMYAGLETAHGAAAADGCLEAVRDFVQSELRLEGSSRDLTAIDWAGKEGAVFVNSILNRTLEVFSEP
jgi:hypothetical protein